MKWLDPEMTSGPFICPECGSRESAAVALVETVFSEGDPWSGVLEEIQCAKCGSVVPAHLAERWNGISAEQAADEWKRDYRATAPKWGEGGKE
jgi:hypothetical protein